MIYILIMLLSPLFAFIYARANSIKLELGHIGVSFIVSLLACFGIVLISIIASDSIYNFQWVKDKQTTELYNGFSVTQQDFSKEIVNKKTSDWLGGFMTNESVETKTVFIIESDSSTVIIEVKNASKLNVTSK